MQNSYKEKRCVQCESCGGIGWVVISENQGIQNEAPCPDCGGCGVIEYEEVIYFDCDENGNPI